MHSICGRFVGIFSRLFGLIFPHFSVNIVEVSGLYMLMKRIE